MGYENIIEVDNLQLEFDNRSIEVLYKIRYRVPDLRDPRYPCDHPDRA